MSPTLGKEPPVHPIWCHEAKFDGSRLQNHKGGKEVVLFSKYGNDFMHRYPTIATAVAKIPTQAETVVRVRLDRQATAISLLVVLGIRRDGQKVLLSVRNIGGESEAAWRAVLDDLVRRGLRKPEPASRVRTWGTVAK
jgi:hypothetical protein